MAFRLSVRYTIYPSDYEADSITGYVGCWPDTESRAMHEKTFDLGLLYLLSMTPTVCQAMCMVRHLHCGYEYIHLMYSFKLIEYPHTYKSAPCIYMLRDVSTVM